MKIPLRWWTERKDWSEIDARHNLPTDAQLLELAKARVRSKDKRGDIIKEPGSFDDKVARRYMSLRGERQVARILGLSMAEDVSIRGDRRTNLLTRFDVPIDVVTRNPWGPMKENVPELLLGVEHEPREDLVLVLVCYLGDADPQVIGWIWETDFRAAGREVQLSANESFAMAPTKLNGIAMLATMNPRQPAAVQGGMF